MWRNFIFQCMTDMEEFDISPHAEEFQLFPHNRCGKMWNFAKFGGILHISTWQMWRNPKFTLFCCCKICFVTNYAVFAKSVLARFTRFRVEKNWAKHCQRHNGPRVLPLKLELSLQLIKRMPPALMPNLATKWHHLHQLQIWPPDCATCISYKFGHQMAPLEMVTFSV